MNVRDMLFKAIVKQLPAGISISRGDIEIMEPLSCMIKFNNAAHIPVQTLDSRDIKEDAYKLEMFIQSINDATQDYNVEQWCDTTRDIICGIHKYLYYELEDAATDAMKNIDTSNVADLDNKLNYLGQQLGILGYIGKVNWIYITRTKPIGNVVYDSKNKQGMPCYSINFNIYYKKGA